MYYRTGNVKIQTLEGVTVAKMPKMFQVDKMAIMDSMAKVARMGYSSCFKFATVANFNQLEFSLRGENAQLSLRARPAARARESCTADYRQKKTPATELQGRSWRAEECISLSTWPRTPWSLA